MTSGSSALGQRSGPHVNAVTLEDVVDDECDRHGAHDLRELLLAPDALLQGSEGHRPVVREGDDFAVQHGAVRQVRRRRGDLGKPPRDEFFAARPEPRLAPAAHELRANAVPLPLDQPVLPIAERLRRALEWRRQEKRVRLRGIGLSGVRGDDGREPLRRRRPVPHEPRRDSRCFGARRERQRPHHQRLRDADPELAGQQLVEEEPFGARQAQPPRCDHRPLSVDRHFLKRHQAVFDPRGER
jgi:hypothetical protein